MSKQSDPRNFFGKRNAETGQEPSSSGCSESDKTESSQKPARTKRLKVPIYLVRSIQMDDLMFCDTCLIAKACSNPFTEGVLTSKILLLFKRRDPDFQ